MIVYSSHLKTSGWLRHACQLRLTFPLRLKAYRKEGSLACGEKCNAFFILADSLADRSLHLQRVYQKKGGIETMAQAQHTAAKSALRPEKAKSRKPIKFSLLYFAILGLVGFISIPGGILLVGGTLPTIACWLSDRLPGKPFAVSVALMNMGGVAIFLIRVVPYGHNFDKAMIIVGDSLTWLAIYMFAMIGWGIYFGLPVLISRYLSAQIRYRIDRVQKRQKDLIEMWGKDVAVVAHSKQVAD